jgi:hypothetical protein
MWMLACIAMIGSRRGLHALSKVLLGLVAGLMSLHAVAAFASADRPAMDFLQERPSLHVTPGSPFSLGAGDLAPGETRLVQAEIVYRGVRPARSVGVFAANLSDPAPGTSPLCRSSELSDRLELEITTGTGALLYRGSVAELARSHGDPSTSVRLARPIAAGSSKVRFAIRLDPTTGNSYMGCRVSVDINWHLII